MDNMEVYFFQMQKITLLISLVDRYTNIGKECQNMNSLDSWETS